MFIEDIRNDFYNVLLGNRVLLLVHYDVDAICTCKILQDLFKCDNISYTLVPVGGVSELKTAYEENNEEIKYVVLVNCGGTIDLVDILQPEEDVVFFVLDAHKPTDVCNVYSDGQVRLVYKDEEENIPNFDNIFRDEDQDESEEVASGAEGLEALVERRRERRAWEERRNTLMFNYTQFSYYGKPSACAALELAGRVSRGGWAALWAAAVALQAQVAAQARSPARALLDADCLQRHLAHYTSANPNTSVSVSQQADVSLPLYRSWSLEQALRHSPSLGPQLRLHTRAGDARLRQLLADMGVPLQQARQAYRSMDVELRRSLATALEAAAARQRLGGASHAGWLLRRALRPELPALDLAWALAALLERDGPRAQGFRLALAALELDGPAAAAAWQQGAAAAQAALAAAAALVLRALRGQELLLAGPFAYCIVPEGSAEARLVSGPLWLGVAARWAAAAVGGARPVLASAPAPAPAHCLLLGVPPPKHNEPRNLFGAAFEQAATKCGASVSLDFMDSSIITLPVAQRAQFLDALTALLA